ncbi:MAG: hypothetical protein ACR2NI_11065 [Pirellulales bacterium]
MNFIIPAIGIGGLVALLFANSASGKASKPTKNAQRVDVDSLLKSSSINRSVSKSKGIPKTSASIRVRNANIVLDEFQSAGVPFGIALSALVNANYESRLTAALGDSKSGTPHSFGLFQLNIYGAGRGMTAEQMLDPKTNTIRIIEDYKKNGKPLDDAYTAGASVATLAGLFGKYIERPSDREGALTKRANYARELFPSIANNAGEELYR